MPDYEVRRLHTDDFSPLMEAEQRLFGDDEVGVLGPYYIRLCCDVLNDTCFIATHGSQVAGYLLGIVHEREAQCSTLAVTPEHQGSRVAFLLIRAFVAAIVNRVQRCTFTVKPDNKAARALHASLGAREVGMRRDYYGPGDLRLVLAIDEDQFAKLKHRYERLGLVHAEDAGHVGRVSSS